MPDLGKRLAKLEAAAGEGGGFAHLLSDELFVACMDVSRALLADPEASEDDLATARDAIADTEAMIRKAGARERSETWPGYTAYIAGLRKGAAPLVPSVIGWDYDDWDKPGVMDRRAALRARPDIARLLAEGVNHEAA